MCRLLQAVVGQKTERPQYEESLQYQDHWQETESVEQVPESSNHLESRTYKEEDYSPQLSQTIVPKRVRLTSSLVNLPCATGSTKFGPGIPIKEGLVEKKGHSVAFLMWPK